MKRHFLIAVVLSVVLASLSLATELTTKGLGNDQELKAWVGYGDPNGGSIGGYLGWHEDCDSLIYSAGLRAEWDVSNEVWEALDKTLDPPDTWRELAAALDARPYVWAEIGPVSIGENAQAYAGGGIGARVSVFAFELGGQLFEGGQVRLNGQTLDKSGWRTWMGIQRAWKF